MRFYAIKLCIFLFTKGVDEDYLNIAIKNGGISVLMKISTAKLVMFVRPKKISFNDNRWHKINLYRRIQEVRRCLVYVCIYYKITIIVLMRTKSEFNYYLRDSLMDFT